MELLNCTVQHKQFGEGTVTAQIDRYITVRFPERDVTFEYIKAFPDFLRCADAQLQAAVEADIAQKQETKRKQAEADAQARRAAEEIAKTSSKHTTAQMRKSNENNLAFKCNFCDGGCSEGCIGYKGVCSDEQIRYNIEVKHHSWCSNPKSPCCQYLNGTITRAELDKQNADGDFVCYESRMLTAWTAAAGEDLNENGGIHQGRRIQDAASDSLAVLTTRSPDANEDARVIFAVFITGQVVEGNELYAGYVVAKDDYKIELTPEEAEKMPFWHYYKNTDGGARWSQGLYRYLKDTVAARILADIVDLKTGSDKVHAQEVLGHYCELKGLDVNKIPAANGAK